MAHKKSRGWLFWLSAIFLPPLALVGLLLNRSTWVKTIVGAILLSLWTMVWALLLLTQLFGLRIESAGSGGRPIFSFGSADTDYEKLAEHRQQQRAHDSGVIPREPKEGIKVSWPRFRGPGGDGEYEEAPILTHWPEDGLEELWRQPVGGGYASFAAVDGVAFTIEQRQDQETVTAYDLRTGREIWAHGWEAFFQESMGGDGPRATPTWDQGLVYALGAQGELRALQADTGELIWRRNILEDAGAENIQWGMAASPLILDDAVIVQPGGPEGHSVVAYHKLTGEVLWHALSDTQAYTTPMTASLAGRHQLLLVSATRALGLDLEEKDVLWEVPWVTSYDINASQPLLVDDNRFFISAGYGHGAALVEITPQDEGYGATTVWSSNRMKNRFSSSVLHQGHVYGFDEAILACLEVETGELMWKGGRYGHGQLLLAGEHLVVLTEKGEVTLVEASPERFNEKARFQAIQGKTWNVPAIAEGVLLVRNAREMAAFRIHGS